MNTDIGAKYMSPFLNAQSTPFSNKSSVDDNLMRAYSQLDALKQQQAQQQMQQIAANQSRIPERNVFTDIQEELSNIGEDERNFIESSTEYQKLNMQYQNEFSSFLIGYFGNEYLKTEYGKTPERILAVIRNKKDQYKSKFASDISEIKSQNNVLAQKNTELEKTNVELQKQLKKIQDQLLGGKK